MKLGHVTPATTTFCGPTQGGSVLYVCTKFEADRSFRSKVIRGPQMSPHRRPPSRGAGPPKFNQLEKVTHYLHLQTQFGEDRCTQFRVIVVTDTARLPATNTHT